MQILQFFQNPAGIILLVIVVGWSLKRAREEWATIKAERIRQEASRNAVFTMLANSLSELAANNGKILSAYETTEKALNGVMKACMTIADETGKHRETVREFGKLVFGNDPGREALTIPSDADRDKKYAEIAYRAAGHTPEEAETMAELDEIKASSAYPTS